MNGPAAASRDGTPVPPAGLVLDGFEPVEGPAFPMTAKVAASVLLGAVALLAVLNRDAVSGIDAGWGGLAFGIALAATLLAGWWSILTGRTSFDGAVIRQTGLFTKQIALADIKRLKLVHVPGLEAVLIPRLVVRGAGITVVTFQAADPRVLAAFRRLVHGAG